VRRPCDQSDRWKLLIKRAWLAFIPLALLVACGSSSAAPTPSTPAPTTQAVTPTRSPSRTPTRSATPVPQPSPRPVITTPAPAPVSTVPVEAPNFCRLTELSITSGQASAAAGTIYYPILFRNISGRTCQLRGYPGVALLDSAGRQVAQAQRIAGPPNVEFVTLVPGQVASAALAAGDVPVGGATSCPEYNSIVVTPPDETHATVVNFSFRVCEPTRIYQVVAGTRGN
jgi:hypothetical protein